MAKEEDYFDNLFDSMENEWMEELNELKDETFVNTGSLSLNALFSGSIWGGIPGNSITAFAGEPSTGKTYYAMSIGKEFLKEHENSKIAYYESEYAVTPKTIQNRGIDPSLCKIIPVGTVEEFRTQITRMVDSVLKAKIEKRRPLMAILDSLGNLSTLKEMEDISTGKNVRDMTRAQLIRGAFRAITLKLGKACIPMVITNHVYDVIGSYVPIKKMNGGSGLDFAASQIGFLSKKKDSEKDESGKAVTNGVIITVVLKKARHTIENKKVETYLNYRTGLDPYYGLLDLAVKFDIFKKVSTKIELPGGSTEFASRIEADPTKYFTDEILDKIDGACKDEFLYGKTNASAAPTGPEEKK